MKTKLLIVLLAGAVVAASCGKEKTPSGTDTPPGGSSASAIKVNLPAEGPLSVLLWKANDAVRIGSSVLSVKEGAESRTATLNGEPQKDKFYTIAYPSNLSGVDVYMEASFAGQLQNGNGSVDHLLPTVLIEDATSISDITLSKAWAAANGATWRCNGVLALNLTLPADAGAVSEIILESAGVKFPANNSGNETVDKLDLHLNGVTAAQSIKAYLSVSEKVVDIAAETGIKITVVGDQSYNILLPQAVKMGGDLLTEITVSDASKWTAHSVVGGAGTEASPYILKTAEDIEQMAELLVEGNTVWFELGADIDMTSVLQWMPLNVTAPYSKAVHFDGKGHTISNFKCESAIYPSLFGVLNGTVQNVVFDKAEIKGTGKMGVVAGYCGTNLGSADAPNYVIGKISGVTVKDSSVSGDSYAGGVVAQVNCPTEISDCHAINTSIVSTGERVGGIVGQAGISSVDIGITIKECTAENVTAEAQKNVGGIIGVSYGDVLKCTASGHLTTNLENAKEVSVGGVIGHLENGNAADCSASTVIEVTLQGRGLGGFVGTFKAGKIERCYATGSVSGIHRNTGGFVGLIQTSLAAATIENCYATGKVSANSYEGGFVGLVDGQPYDVLIKNCYCTGDVVGTAFGIGGFIGFQSCTKFQAIGCVAWNEKVTAGNYAAESWSSGAFVGVTYPLSTITNCYRHPAMELTAYWVPAVGYSHPDVSPSSPLIKQDGTPSKATSTANGQDGYPQFPYHGKVAAAGKTLPQLASDVLGWDSAVWDFSGNLPVLKK